MRKCAACPVTRHVDPRFVVLPSGIAVCGRHLVAAVTAALERGEVVGVQFWTNPGAASESVLAVRRRMAGARRKLGIRPSTHPDMEGL